MSKHSELSELLVGMAYVAVLGSAKPFPWGWAIAIGSALIGAVGTGLYFFLR